MKQFVTLLLLLATTFAHAQYEPASQGERVTHTHYTLDYNEEHEQANWVYYILTAEMKAGTTSRSDKFRPDPKVSTQSAQLADYTGSGYDRGHLCPAGDMTHSATAMQESFFLSNMSPQFPSFNRGIWRSCESFVRELASDTLYIVTGPIFSSPLGSIGENNVTIPSAYYKVAYDPSIPQMWAYIIPNKKGDKDLQEYKTTVDCVEEATGIDLFYQLPDQLEQRLESQR